MQDVSAGNLKNQIIRASAGTGKTFQLTNRYLSLLLLGVSADQILATTFTRKAAGEILDRVVLRLAEAALDETRRRELGEFLDVSSLSGPQCLEALHKLLRNLHRLRIGTLDSFFLQLARSRSLELDLPSAWRVVDPVEESTLRDEAIGAMLHEEKTSDLVNLAHLLSKGETQRSVGQLIRATVQDLHGLYLESDEQAWTNLPAAKPLDRETLLMLFDELRAAELPNRRMEEARNADLDRAIREDWETFAKKGMAVKTLSGDGTYYRKPIPADVIQTYQKLLDHVRALLLHRLAMHNKGAYDLLQRYDREFRRLKRSYRLLRFADVTNELATQLGPVDLESASKPELPSRPESTSRQSEQLAYRLDGPIHHLLLDEFQDTAPAQWHVLRPFAERIATNLPQSTFLCVGDVKQAIYGWRGGVAEIFDAVGEQLPGLDHEQLNTSYRSSPPVIDAVNRIFESLDQHTNLGAAEDAIRAWRKRFQKHSTDRTELEGYVTLQTSPAARDQETQDDVTLEYAAELAAELANAHQERSIGILVRRNETVGKLIYRLQQRNVAASEEGGNPLVDSAAVQILLSVLRLADHPGDTVARFHIVNSPLGPHLGFRDPRDDGQADTIACQVRRSLLDQGYGATIAGWAKPLQPHCSRRESGRLEQFVELAYAYQRRATLRTDAFLQLVAEQRVSDPTSAGVRVMTIHQAKGLEFDTVILPELESQLTGQPGPFVVAREKATGPVRRVCHHVNKDLLPLLPKTIQRMISDAATREVTEAMCVLYVALTRAVHELRLIIRPSKKSEKTIPRTCAGLLRAALVGNASVAAETVLFQNGSPDWRKKRRRGETVDTTETGAKTPAVVDVDLAPVTGPRRRGLDRTSPSGLEGGPRARLGEVLQAGNRTALAKGTLLHALFEQVEWLDDGCPTSDQLRQAAEQVLLDQGQEVLDLPSLLSDFETMLRMPETDAVLRRSAYQSLESLGLSNTHGGSHPEGLRLSVERERVFAVRDGDNLISGTIDRLVLIYSGDTLIGADVIDFKSDNIETHERAQIEQRKAYYRPQLQAYRQAVSKMTGLPLGQIATRLVFVTPGLVESA